LGGDKDFELELKKIYQAIEQASDWVVITDRDGNIEYANRVVENITGYTRNELIGKNPRVFKSGLHDREFYKKMWDTILSGETFYGSIVNRKKNGETFELFHTITPLFDEDGNITHFISTAKDISYEKNLREKIESIYFIDLVTNLYNRSFFINRITQAIIEARGRDVHLAIIGLDIDSFTSINYQYGYQMGDMILKEVGNILKSIVPDSYTVARIGGDDFGILCIDIKDTRKLDSLVGKIIERFSDPVVVAGLSIPIDVDMGIAVYPQDGDNTHILVANMGLALNVAKRDNLKKSKYVFFSEELNKRAERYFTVQEHVLREMRKDTLIIRYQPYFDIKTMRPVGMEALSRCSHVDAKILTVEELFSFLEESGMIVSVGEWIIERIVEDIKRWRGIKMPVSINISPVQFKDRYFVERLEDNIRSSGINPELIGIEMTERVFIEDMETVKEKLTRLKSMGMSISIDDFGKGYSSLIYLKRLPIDNIKIDISFIRDIDNDPDDASIVSAIISMAHELGIKTIAEGVEDKEQLKILRLLRCDMVQGYLLSLPLLPEELEKQFNLL